MDLKIENQPFWPYFGPILAHKSGRIKTRGPNFGQVIENMVVHLLKIKISGSMGRFLSYRTLKLKIGHFGLILAHKSIRIETRGPKFGQVVENIIVHLLKSNLRIYGLVFELSDLKIENRPFWPYFGP